MTEKYVSVYPVSFGTRVFMHRNGVIYQAEYRGIKVIEDGICGHNVNTQHIFLVRQQTRRNRGCFKYKYLYNCSRRYARKKCNSIKQNKY